MIYGPMTLWEIDGETMETVTDFILGGLKITADAEWSHEIKWCLLLGRNLMTNLDSILKSRDITLPTKVCLAKAMVFPEDLCFWTVVLGKTLESPLYCKEIQLVYPKRNQSGIFIGRADAEAEAPILWPPGVKNWLTKKDPDAGKDWGREEKGMTEDEMVGWHHGLNGHKLIVNDDWWWTGSPGMLQSTGLQRVGHNWETELNWSLPWASLVAELVKNPPAIQESPVQFLHWEDLLEKGSATHSSMLAWRIP